MVWVYLQFGGGLETLFDSVKSHKVEIPSKKKEGLSDRTTVKGVINYIQKKMLKKNPEMFLKGKELRPGILVLINDIDWELGGKEECIVENNDVVLFLSTLHGG
ncbi:ubiquitin-related modifier Urm1 [Chloropicon roscoffensis]|uniref:Ubiquitin-related modifier 1 homolog n=1 Tax=Chloropicon roscoffensis TaxID=1461544 RepID=A0A7S2X2A9_9CHLO|mmetsp:Transcript_4067/g.12236  ORF Transcript_4067/g.12236 Transcript_4067/m.12236 type:complete len:104 (+) Transcript_4067:375-686(+)|eukprot:CAMPEP_0198473614 /NCGR_PEP_ID=MMETSP1456-20131121/35668_1 /TAXON_ID=1461544 ORGANISM="Unidentified sp., Strain RCC1871" /NCGR_SAMPLE_ID=MMETSP1456 /ASSEMBLY_ACC=CAM_ASM_001119 /LENGTH=103 /DNA_ID=CAMNT_0044200281 /DNA_START=141 /DNA_END=452 /DNA_ORIENTATION=-